MALSLKKRLDAQGQNLDPSALYVAVESYASHDGSIARGTRFRGDHPAVVARPQFWASADLDDQTLRNIRAAISGAENLY